MYVIPNKQIRALFLIDFCAILLILRGGIHKMQLDKQTMVELTEMVVDAVVKALAGKSVTSAPNITGKSANKKTAFLLPFARS